MEQAAARTGIVVLTACALVGLGPTTASAADGGGPSAAASCVAQVFVPQATAEPRDVANQIAFIKREILPVAEERNFGDAVSGLLARADSCRG